MSRMILAVTSLTVLLSMQASAATYNNNDLDDGDHRCQVVKQETSIHSVVSCNFSDDKVTFELADGSSVKATLSSDELPEDGSAVIAVDEDGQSWQITFLVPEIWRTGSE